MILFPYTFSFSSSQTDKQNWLSEWTAKKALPLCPHRADLLFSLASDGLELASWGVCKSQPLFFWGYSWSHGREEHSGGKCKFSDIISVWVLWDHRKGLGVIMPACGTMVNMSLWSRSGLGKTRELEPCISISPDGNSNHSTLVGLGAEGRRQEEEEEKIGDGEQKCGLCLLRPGEQVGLIWNSQFSYVCFLLLLLLACFLLILVCSWLLRASKAILCPSLTYTFSISLPMSCFKLPRKRVQQV